MPSYPSSHKRFSIRKQLKHLQFWDHQDSTHLDPTSRKLSAGDRLPCEVVLIIFEYFFFDQPYYRHAFTYRSTSPAFYYGENVVSRPDPLQAALVGLLQVSKTWCLAGTSLLYANPYIISIERVRQFARTLRSAPYLAPLVKTLFVLNQGAADRNKSWEQSLSSRKLAVLARVELFSALVSCTSLRELTITTREGGPVTILPLEPAILPVDSIGQNLRKLTIYGSPDSSPSTGSGLMSSDVSLPNLELLCFREVHFLPTHQFPSLPSLQTLQIAQSSHSCAEPKLIPYSLFPSLTTLELYQNFSDIVPDDECFRNLHRLHLVGHNEFGLGSTWQYRAPMENIKYLALGHYFVPGKLLTIRMPRRLETLVFLLNFPVSFRSPHTIDTGMMRDLHASLENTFKRCSKLKRLVIMGSLGANADDSDLSSVLSDIDDFCTIRGVTFLMSSGMVVFSCLCLIFV